MADVLLCSAEFWENRAGELLAIDPTLQTVRLVGDEDPDRPDLERITIAIYSTDLYPDRHAAFLRSCVRAPNLNWFQTVAAGTDDPIFAQLLQRGVRVTTGSGTTATAIAQTVILYLLALSRDLPRLARAQAERRWAPEDLRDLEGMRLGIVGFGAIGREVARLATAFGMEIVGLRRNAADESDFPTWPSTRFGELLEWAEAVVVCAPLNEQTRGMFDSAAFARMRPGSWFINVGRGAIVDETALIAALVNGPISGAGLDVFETEPLPAASPLWGLPNVIITPHCSGHTPSSSRRASELAVENFRRHAAGEPLINLVER